MPLARIASASVLQGVTVMALAAVAVRAAGIATADISIALHAETCIEVEERRCHAALATHIDARIYLW